jgi:hypothetical protein
MRSITYAVLLVLWFAFDAHAQSNLITNIQNPSALMVSGNILLTRMKPVFMITAITS